MASSKSSSVVLRRRRRWSFADCVFDEANWSLTVAGHRVSIESKPLELLRELLLHAGDLVSKSELLDNIWPNVIVVEASLPTAIRKLRLALNDDDRDAHIIETVPRVGYRLAVAVDVHELPDPSNKLPGLAQATAATNVVGSRRFDSHALRILIPALVVSAGGIALMLLPVRQLPAASSQGVFPDHEVISALRRLDIARIDSMLAAGWKPGVPDRNGDNALNRLLEMCEWDPGHDRAKLLLVARALLDGGVAIDQRNMFGDTAYSIAKAERYCGPDHPVTIMIHNMCYAKGKLAGDRCLATYELKRRPA